MNPDTERICKRCGQPHALEYALFQNGDRHLFYRHGRTRIYVPRIAGLEIPEVKSKTLLKSLAGDSDSLPLFAAPVASRAPVLPPAPSAPDAPGRKIIIQFDGGCSPNPGRKYGSYVTRLDGVRVGGESRVELGHGTNNEAEFDILQVALESLASWLAGAQLAAQGCELELWTDSTIVRNHVGFRQRGVPPPKVKPSHRPAQSRMVERAARCWELAHGFRSVLIAWQPRERNVAQFGH